MVEGEALMYIDIFEITSRYKGIGRNKNFLPLLKNSLIKKYLNLLNDDALIQLTNSNYCELKNILNSFPLKMRNKYEIIIFGETDSSMFNELRCSPIFYGYDVTGDSYNESPIFRAAFDNSTNKKANMNEFLNCFGLCDNILDCNKIIECVYSDDENFFEKDGRLRPIAIYSLGYPIEERFETTEKVSF